MAIREVLTSFTFEQQRLMINLIGTDVGDVSTLLTPTNTVVPALNEIVNGDVDLVNQTHGMDPGTSGSPSLYWDAGQGFYKVDATKIGLTSSLAITGNLEVDGDITFRAGSGSGGTLTFGDLNTDNIIFNADVQSSVVPDTTANYNLGTAAKQWNNLWIDGTASIDTLAVDENSTFTGYLQVDSGDIRVPSTQNTVDLFDDYATTVEAFGDATSIRIGDTTGTLTLRNPTIVGSETTQNLFNTVATTVNAFGAATTINMGVSGGGGNTNFNILSDDVVCSGDLNINGGELLSQQTTFNLLINNDNINVGNATGQGTTTINNRLQINGNLAIGGTSTYIELPDDQTNAFRFREGSNDYLQFRTENGLERVVVWKDLYVIGNLDVSGTETVIDTTTLLVEDKNIELGATSAPSDTTADGGGITLKATTDKTITYNNTDTVWETNIGLKVVSASAKGIRSHVTSVQATDTNKALRVTNGSDVDTFNVSYKGAVRVDHSGNAGSDQLLRLGNVNNSGTNSAHLLLANGYYVSPTDVDGTGAAAKILADGTIHDSKGELRSMPLKTESSNASYTLIAGDAGKVIHCHTTTTTVVIPNSVMSAGNAVTILNGDGSNNITISEGTGFSLRNTADGTQGNRTLASFGMATIYFSGAGVGYIAGSGLS